MPRAVQRLRTATRTWISATCRSKSLAIRDWPRSLMQFILVSTRLRRWYPLHCRQMARPMYREALTASFRAMAPALVGFQGLAFCAAVASFVRHWFKHNGEPVHRAIQHPGNAEFVDPQARDEGLGASASRQVPRGDRPRRRVILVATAVSSIARQCIAEPCHERA